MSPDDWTGRISRHIREDGSVVVPSRIAAWLESKAGLTADRRINLMVTDPAAYEVLAALRLAALQFRSGTGTETVMAQQNPQQSELWTTTEVAARLNVTDRCVRKWIAQGRLPAARCGGRWLIRPHHVRPITNH